MIDSTLVQELCTTIESNLKFKKEKTSRDRLDILKYVPVKYQLLVGRLLIQMMNKLLGENFLKNSFFRNLDFSFIVTLSNNMKLMHVRQGELIYHFMQPSDHGSPRSASVFNFGRQGQLSPYQEPLFQDLCQGVVLRRLRILQKLHQAVLSESRSTDNPHDDIVRNARLDF